MKNSILAVILCGILFTACQDNSNNDSKAKADSINENKEDSGSLSKKIDDDASFVTEAGSGVLMEVELGNYAEKNAASAKVKEFGRRMAKDHSKDRDELKRLASQKNITIPGVTGEKFQKHIDELEQKKGTDFDKAYISFMVSDHHDDIDEFEKETKNGKDADIVAFANKGIPILKDHLAMAQSINKSLK